MRRNAWPMRSSSSRVRTMKVTSQSGDAFIYCRNYLHTDRAKATRIRRYRSIPQRRRDGAPIVTWRTRAASVRHRGAQSGAVTQSHERGADFARLGGARDGDVVVED